MRARLVDCVPALMPGGPTAVALSSLADDVWLVELADGGRAVAKHQFYGLLTRDEPYDLLRVEVDVLGYLRRCGCPVPFPFGFDRGGQFVLLEYAGPTTLAAALRQPPPVARRRLWAGKLLGGLVRIEAALAVDAPDWGGRVVPGASRADLSASWRQAVLAAAEGLRLLLDELGGPSERVGLEAVLQQLAADLGDREPSLGPTDYGAGNVVLDATGERLTFLELGKLGWDWTERRALQYTTCVELEEPLGLLDRRAVEAYGGLWDRALAPARVAALDGHRLIFYLLLARRLRRGGRRAASLARALAAPLSRAPLVSEFCHRFERLLRRRAYAT